MPYLREIRTPLKIIGIKIYTDYYDGNKKAIWIKFWKNNIRKLRKGKNQEQPEQEIK